MKLSQLAEQQIKKAELNGSFDNLKGVGKPLPHAGDRDIGAAAGFRIMAEAGAVPEEITLRKAVSAQAKILRETTDPDARKEEMARLADLQMRLAIAEDARRKFLSD